MKSGSSLSEDHIKYSAREPDMIRILITIPGSPHIRFSLQNDMISSRARGCTSL